MLAASVCGSDGFLELSFEAQALYVQLCLNADGSGVVDCRKKVARYMGASEGAYVELVDAGFVLPMADGSLCVVADWWVCNSFDRYHYYPGGHYAELVRDFDLSEPMRDGNARPRYVSAGEGVASSGFLVKASRRGTTGDGTGARTGEHTSKGEQRNGEQRNQLNGTEGEQGSGGLGERDGFSHLRASRIRERSSPSSRGTGASTPTSSTGWPSRS